MTKLQTISLFVIVALCGTIIVGQDRGELVLFEVQFSESALPEGLIITGGQQSYGRGTLHWQSDSAQVMALNITGAREWRDYALDVNLKQNSGRVVLQVRSDAKLCAGYYLDIGERLRLAKADADCKLDVLQTIDLDKLLNADWVTWRLAADGDRITVAADGEVLLTANDNAYKQGYAALSIFPLRSDDADIELDFVRVVSLDEDLIATATAATPVPTVTSTASVTASPTHTPTATATATHTPTSTFTLTPVPTDTYTPTHTPTPTATVTHTPTSTDTLTPVPTDTPTPEPEIARPEAPQTLVFWDRIPDMALDELKGLGFVPETGVLVFERDFAGLNRAGNWFVPLGAHRSVGNGIIAGELTVYASDLGESSCRLSMRTGTNDRGVVTSFLDVGIQSGGGIVLQERRAGEFSLAVDEYKVLEFEVGRPLHVMMIAIDDRVTVYVNGWLIFDYTGIGTGEGIMGVSALDAVSGSRCEARNLWGYQID